MNRRDPTDRTPGETPADLHFGPPVEPEDRGRFGSDVSVGVNLRWKDNLFQWAAVMLGLLAGAIAGAVVTPGRAEGPAVGGFAGVVVGLFGSGIGLMIYRGRRELRRRG